MATSLQLGEQAEGDGFGAQPRVLIEVGSDVSIDALIGEVLGAEVGQFRLSPVLQSHVAMHLLGVSGSPDNDALEAQGVGGGAQHGGDHGGVVAGGPYQRYMVVHGDCLRSDLLVGDGLCLRRCGDQGEADYIEDSFHVHDKWVIFVVSTYRHYDIPLFRCSDIPGLLNVIHKVDAELGQQEGLVVLAVVGAAVDAVVAFVPGVAHVNTGQCFEAPVG